MKENLIIRKIIARKKFILKFYNQTSANNVDSLENIPLSSLNFLINLDYQNLVAPFIKLDLLAGKSLQDCEITYGLSKNCIRTIAGKCGTHLPKN